jgi:hypothetical protein
MNECPHCHRTVHYLCHNSGNISSIYDCGTSHIQLYRAKMFAGGFVCPLCRTALFTDPFEADRWLTGVSAAP